MSRYVLSQTVANIACEFGVEIGRVLGPTAEEVPAQPSPLEGRIPGTFPVEGASGPVMGAGGGRR